MAKRAPDTSEELSKAAIERQSHLADEILAEVVAEDEARLESDQR
jgi:hypothetical protein